MYKFQFSVLTLSVFFSINAFAQPNIKINTVTTAMPFLRVNADARVGGMGDVGIATTPDVNGAYLNASNMAFNEKDFGVGV